MWISYSVISVHHYIDFVYNSSKDPTFNFSMYQALSNTVTEALISSPNVNDYVHSINWQGFVHGWVPLGGYVFDEKYVAAQRPALNLLVR